MNTKWSSIVWDFLPCDCM